MNAGPKNPLYRRPLNLWRCEYNITDKYKKELQGKTEAIKDKLIKPNITKEKEETNITKKGKKSFGLPLLFLTAIYS